jgi:hypothetical protein
MVFLQEVVKEPRFSLNRARSGAPPTGLSGSQAAPPTVQIFLYNRCNAMPKTWRHAI